MRKWQVLNKIMNNACLRELLHQSFWRQGNVVDVQGRVLPLLKLGSAICNNGRIGLSSPGEPDPESVVAVIWREGDENSSPIANTVAVGLMPHRLTDLMGAWNVPRPGLGVAQDLLRSKAETGYMPKFGEVTVHGLQRASDVRI